MADSGPIVRAGWGTELIRRGGGGGGENIRDQNIYFSAFRALFVLICWQDTVGRAQVFGFQSETFKNKPGYLSIFDKRSRTGLRAKNDTTILDYRFWS